MPNGSKQYQVYERDMPHTCLNLSSVHVTFNYALFYIIITKFEF
jgi:hypothetical protein